MISGQKYKKSELDFQNYYLSIFIYPCSRIPQNRSRNWRKNTNTGYNPNANLRTNSHSIHDISIENHQNNNNSQVYNSAKPLETVIDHVISPYNTTDNNMNMNLSSGSNTRSNDKNNIINQIFTV